MELISFKLCPFAQATTISFLQNNIDHTTTYIDINDPPVWFDELSPTGAVPILKLEGDIIIFESAAINEYVNEQYNASMMPEDPRQRAINRAWTQFCGALLGDHYELVGATDENAVENIEYDMHEKLDRLEGIKNDSPYFNGDQLNLIDTAYATLFMRLDLLKSARDILDQERFPKLCAWSAQLLVLDVVKNSVVEKFPQLYQGMLKMRGGFIGKLSEQH